MMKDLKVYIKNILENKDNEVSENITHYLQSLTTNSKNKNTKSVAQDLLDDAFYEGKLQYNGIYGGVSDKINVDNKTLSEYCERFINEDSVNFVIINPVQNFLLSIDSTGDCLVHNKNKDEFDTDYFDDVEANFALDVSRSSNPADGGKDDFTIRKDEIDHYNDLYDSDEFGDKWKEEVTYSMVNGSKTILDLAKNILDTLDNNEKYLYNKYKTAINTPDTFIAMIAF